MDTITHGIAGALTGDAFFSRRYGTVATFALTLGAIFPDIDVVREAVSHDPMALLNYHRGITHSFVAMPFFALALAALTRWYMRRRPMEGPSFGVLFGIYLLGIASHIFIDLITSFGTRIWDPISYRRYSWDWIFIVDAMFTSLVLVPQVVAWVYGDRERSRRRAWMMWALFAALAAFIVWASHLVGTPISLGTWVIAVAVLGAVFFLPAWRGWGFRVTTTQWCRGGFLLAVAYLGACALAHHAALARVEQFARAEQLPVERLAAIPAPPGLLDWNGLVLTPSGVYESRLTLARAPAAAGAPQFSFVADSPPNRYTAAALALPTVKTYLGFARFPVIRFAEQDGRYIVDLRDVRFFRARRRTPRSFTWRVVFDASGHPIQQGWLRR
jgi:membrane-bound metal-dependent hydrolase YbcI (DUF457 family)